MNVTIDLSGYLHATFVKTYRGNDGAFKPLHTSPLEAPKALEILQGLQSGDLFMGLESRLVHSIEDFSKPICGVDFDVGDMEYTFEEEETILDSVALRMLELP
jgi:hypothetical protein